MGLLKRGLSAFIASIHFLITHSLIYSVAHCLTAGISFLKPFENSYIQ